MNVGDTLKNGSTVVACKGSIVLALNAKKEYVVWTVDSNGNAYAGDYHQGLQSAMDAYNAKS